MPNKKETELWRLVDKAFQNSIEKFGDIFAKDVARDLLANGVTVQEGKPLEAFLHPVVAHKGLKAKYLVFGAASGKEIKNCFVLRPDKDPAAVEALRAYASATDNETLAEDIYNWVGKGNPVQKWISVKDRLPEKRGHYFIAYRFKGDGANMRFFGEAMWHDDIPDNRYVKGNHFSNEGVDGMYVTHWMEIPPLPQPPKGE